MIAAHYVDVSGHHSRLCPLRCCAVVSLYNRNHSSMRASSQPSSCVCDYHRTFIFPFCFVGRTAAAPLRCVSNIRPQCAGDSSKRSAGNVLTLLFVGASVVTCWLRTLC
ncbi:unnamed protein product, partial [Ectocarpus sp. 12 AP-2014]